MNLADNSLSLIITQIDTKPIEDQFNCKTAHKITDFPPCPNPNPLKSGSYLSFKDINTFMPICKRPNKTKRKAKSMKSPAKKRGKAKGKRARANTDPVRMPKTPQYLYSMHNIALTPLGIQNNGLELRRCSFGSVSDNLFSKMTDEEELSYLVSSQGLSSGYQEWSIKILKCDVYQQEIGIVSNLIENGDYNYRGTVIRGISDTDEFQARAVYGNELMSDKVYYASYNDNGSVRCYKDLVKAVNDETDANDANVKKRKKRKIGWCQGDVIKVALDLERWKCTFYLNGKKVRKSISVQRGRMYYPIISYAGKCKYELVHFR